MSAVILFCTTFVLVFSLGFQSLNVTKGHYVAAFLTSFLISGSNLVILRTVPQGGLVEVAAYMFGGPFGIIASMWLHKRLLGAKVKQQQDSSEAEHG